MDIQIIVLGKLLLAALLGGIIGLEREMKHKEAGVRTMALVTCGSALFSLIALHGLDDYFIGSADTSRIMSEIVSGIGFLGAGMIIFKNDHVRGLTTAASLWVCAAIGMAVAIEWYLVSVIGTLLIAVFLHILGPRFPQYRENDQNTEQNFRSTSSPSRKRVP